MDTQKKMSLFNRQTKKKPIYESGKAVKMWLKVILTKVSDRLKIRSHQVFSNFEEIQLNQCSLKTTEYRVLISIRKKKDPKSWNRNQKADLEQMCEFMKRDHGRYWLKPINIRWN